MRIKLSLPDPVLYALELPVRISDINYGGHMSNDAVLRYAHDARLAWLTDCGYAGETDIGGAGLILVAAQITYRAEVFYGDRLRLELGIADLQRHGFTLRYHLSKTSGGSEVARLHTDMVCFDYTKRRMTTVPLAFVERFAV
jgi:acyl-CoA thioester hydrolase